MTSVPTGAYHGHASGVLHQTSSTVAKPATTPDSAAREPTGRRRLPSRNSPRIIPVVTPATFSTSSMTARFSISDTAKSATATRVTPQNDVMPRETVR